MPITPIQWYEQIHQHYNSLSEFKDVATVEIISKMTADQIKDKSEFLQITENIPGVVSAEDIAKTKETLERLKEIRLELEKWQKDHAKAKASAT